jgi:DNA-binding NarL/FixJ family response regulator
MVTFVPLRRMDSRLSSKREDRSMKLRVAVAEDEPRLLRTIASILDREFDVIAAFPQGRSLLEFVCEKIPDVAVVDLGLPDINGLEVIREIVRRGIDTKVVICSAEKDPDLVGAALQAGAACYVWKQRIASELNEAVRLAARGQQFVSSLG